MALLERINSMKQQNIPDSQIINTLKEEGVSPREINEALSQSKIKSAISINSPANTNSEMQQSIMPTQDQQMMAIPEQNYNHQMYSAEMQSQTYSQQAQAYPQQAQTADYSQQGYYQDQYTQPYDQTQQAYYPQGMDVETVRDISKQEIDEALKKIKSELDSILKFKTEVNFEIQSMDNRLTKIETIIQEIQTSIIRKLGEYGESVSSISQELKATQNSFSKILNPLLDKKRGVSNEEANEEQTIEENQEQPGKSIQQKGQKRKQSSQSKNSVSFEDYLR